MGGQQRAGHGKARSRAKAASSAGAHGQWWSKRKMTGRACRTSRAAAFGRDRRAASHAERARLNATRAIRAAMANLARANPALGRHLAATIRTGRYCSYAPDPRGPIAWER
jgi:hypothetical protein